MKTTTKTEQATVDANAKLANNAEVKVHTTAVTAVTEKVKKIVEGETYSCYLKVEHDMADEVFVAKTRKEYVAEYNVNLKKTAEATLLMCRTVFEASKMLAEHEFNEFCKNIGYKDTSSTIRKFMTIGKVYPRLIKYAQDLPVGWTSIYALTQIAADDFDEMVSRGVAFKNIKGNDLKLMLAKTKDLNKTTTMFKLHKKWLTYNAGHICFTKVPDDRDWRLIEKAFEELSARLPVKFVLQKETAELFKNRRKATYEVAKLEDDDITKKPQMWDYGVTANGVIEACVG